MLNARSHGVQATRMLQEQHRKEFRQQHFTSSAQLQDHQSPGRKLAPKPPRALSPDLEASSPKRGFESPVYYSPSPLRAQATGGSYFPPIGTTPSPQRPQTTMNTAVSPSRRSYHMSPNERRRFYAGYVGRPSDNSGVKPTERFYM